MRIATASGSLKDGGALTVGWSNLLDGTFTFKVEEENVVLYYDFRAFNNGKDGRVVVLHLPDASEGESWRWDSMVLITSTLSNASYRQRFCSFPNEMQTWSL